MPALSGRIVESAADVHGGTRDVPGPAAAPADGVRHVASPPEATGVTTLQRRATTVAGRAAGSDDQDIAVLVVDDHPGVRSAIEALIARTPGLRVVGAVSSGAAAIEGAARLHPAVVLIDLGMPGINGVEATREICKNARAPVIVAFSGSRELWRAARAAGAARTILKDEDPQTLLEAIRTAAQR
jgi:CheY-like chemotaxis protein